MGDALVDAGFRLLEVPLEFAAAAREHRAAAPALPAGAGRRRHRARRRSRCATVHGAGGALIVAPNFNAEVVAEAVPPGHGQPARRDDTDRGFRRAGRRRHGAQAVPGRAGLARRGSRPWLGGAAQGHAADAGRRHLARPTWTPGVPPAPTGFGIGSALYKPGKSRRRRCATPRCNSSPHGMARFAPEMKPHPSMRLRRLPLKGAHPAARQSQFRGCPAASRAGFIACA